MAVAQKRNLTQKSKPASAVPQKRPSTATARSGAAAAASGGGQQRSAVSGGRQAGDGGGGDAATSSGGDHPRASTLDPVKPKVDRPPKSDESFHFW